MTWRLGTVVLTLAIACLMPPNVEAGDGKSFSLRDVDGPTAFDFDGFVPHPITGIREPAASSGRFIADGRGRLTDGVRTLVIGDFPVLRQTFVCSYVVNPNGTGNADCVVDGVFNETFDFVIVERKKEAYFTSTSPNTILRGRTKRQH